VATAKELVTVSARCHEILKRVENGSLGVNSVLSALQDIIEGRFDGPTLQIVVNYSLTIEQLVKAGKYDETSSWLNSDRIPHHLGRTGEWDLTFELISFGGRVSVSAVQQEFERRSNIVPATAQELLAFGIINPDAQLTSRIVAMGTVVRKHGARAVCVLHSHDDGSRCCDVLSLPEYFQAGTEFLAVKK
jgi:hypothetical protein